MRGGARVVNRDDVNSSWEREPRREKRPARWCTRAVVLVARQHVAESRESLRRVAAGRGGLRVLSLVRHRGSPSGALRRGHDGERLLLLLHRTWRSFVVPWG